MFPRNTIGQNAAPGQVRTRPYQEKGLQGMRIVNVFTRFGLGGLERIVSVISAEMARQGHEVHQAAVYPDDRESGLGAELVELCRDAGVKFHRLGLRGGRTINAVAGPPRLARLLGRLQPDIAVSHGDPASYMLSTSARILSALGRPVPVGRLIHSTQHWPTHPFIGRWTESGFRDELTVYPGKATRQSYLELRERFGLQPSRFQESVRYGLIPPAIRHTRDELVREFGAKGERVLLGYVGRFVSQKGVDILLEALGRLPARLRDRYELHLVGAGADEEAMRQLAKSHGLPAVFHAARADIVEWLSGFDAVVMPSRFEGYGLVSIEAFLAGTPLVATLVPGLAETLPPGWPLSVPGENPAAMSQLLTEFIEGKFNRRELMEPAVAWIEQHNSAPAMGRSFAAACEKYLADRQGSRRRAA